MPSILLFTRTTGYQARAFEDAARGWACGSVYATDHCKGLDDPWRDGAMAVRFHDVGASVRRSPRGGRRRTPRGRAGSWRPPRDRRPRTRRRRCGLPFHSAAGRRGRRAASC